MFLNNQPFYFLKTNFDISLRFVSLKVSSIYKQEIFTFTWDISLQNINYLAADCLGNRDTYGSILPGREFGAYLCHYFVGENSTPVSIILVQIKFRKIGWIDNYLCIIENKFQIFLKNLKIWINFSNFQFFEIWNLFSIMHK